ncbi:MAG: response regulator [Verrucomicrobia bacterium]|nr:response regulator [Verrucomicrobiota bacterium]
MKILIIEDDADIRATLADLLQLNGHEVIAAADGVQGVEYAAQKPDFIFCDVMMPHLDGRGVLAAVRQLPGVAEVPFVFLTAKADRADQRDGMALGADDYITKPFAEEEILAALAARVQRHQPVREKIRQLTEHHERTINAHWSHELLTPLNAVAGGLDLLELAGDTMSPEEQKEIFALIREGVTRQERLSRKLIRYFELEQMLRSPSPAAAGPCQAAAAVQAGATKAAQEANRADALVLSLADAKVPLAEELLRDAVGEIVQNAATFSPPGSPVRVTGVLTGGRYRIEITDAGPGLTAEQRAGFGAFTQFDRKSREQQGLGLGLAIARATARVAHGQFSLDPGPDGRGLCVRFDLPAL